MRILEVSRIASSWWASMLDSKWDNKREDFYKSLESLIVNILNHQDMITIDVDYDPDDIILWALYESGVDCKGVLFSARGIFPEKHRMRVSRAGIMVKMGYYSGWDKI